MFVENPGEKYCGLIQGKTLPSAIGQRRRGAVSFRWSSWLVQGSPIYWSQLNAPPNTSYHFQIPLNEQVHSASVGNRHGLCDASMASSSSHSLFCASSPSSTLSTITSPLALEMEALSLNYPNPHGSITIHKVTRLCSDENCLRNTEGLNSSILG